LPSEVIILQLNFAKILTGPCSQDVVTSRSSYLRRLLSESSDVAIALPAGLTFDAFAQAIATCYGSDDAAAALSPASLAAAWAVTGWLELVPGPGPGRDPYGLAHTAEDYFFQEVATDHGRAAGVLRCCAAFLGGEAAGPAADLLVRCLEVLAASDSGSGRWLDDVAALPVEEFLVAVEAMRARFAHDHDLMYTVVDHYLEVRTLLNTNLHWVVLGLIDAQDTGAHLTQITCHRLLLVISSYDTFFFCESPLMTH
jgi:hypothetical protein